VFSALLGLVMVGCGKPPSKPFQSSGTQGAAVGGDAEPVIGPDGKPVDNAAGVPMEASLAAFATHVYTPILGPYCAACHHETFAPKPLGAAEGEVAPLPAGIDKAHLAMLARTNFNAFAGVDQTTVVVKMDYHGGGHNCWQSEAKKCYDSMVTAIGAWLKDLEAAGYKPTPVKYPNSTAQVMLSTAVNVTPATDANQYVAGFVASATVAAPFATATNDVDGPIGTYAMAPMGTAVGGNTPNQAQAITFNMDVKAAGTYYVWARVKTAAAANSRFFIGANGATAIQFNPGATTDWKWVQATVVANNVTSPYSFNVAAPAVIPVRVFYRDPGAKINALVITQRRDDFNGEQFSNQFMELKVPLAVPGADGASIIATVWKKTDAENRKSLGVTQLRFDSAVPLRVKNIKPLINGLYFNNHGTYTIVDTVAGGAGADPIIKTGGSTASTWLADMAVDKLSFSFETIEVSK